MTVEQELRKIPFDTLANEYDRIINEGLDWNTYLSDKNGNWLLDNKILQIAPDWLYPKLLTHFASFNLNYNVQNTYDKKINCLDYLNDNMDFKDPWNKGLLLFMKIDKRSLTVKLQNKNPGLQYNGLVPLIMAAHKKYENISYNAWDRNTMKYILNSSLLEALNWEATTFEDLDYNSDELDGDAFWNAWGIPYEELMDLRVDALTYKSGNKKGQVKDPKSTYTVNSTAHPVFASMPTLVRIMAIQTWCAHPDNRHQYMILDLNDLDHIPHELVTSEIFRHDSKPRARSTNEKMAWEID